MYVMISTLYVLYHFISHIMTIRHLYFPLKPPLAWFSDKRHLLVHNVSLEGEIDMYKV